jgi:HEAT repeats
MSGSFYQELLARVKQGGRLSDSEVIAVRNALESTTTGEDPYTLLHILGKAGDQRLAPVIERYLTVGLGDRSEHDHEEDDDDMLRRLAIEILAQWWKRREVFDFVAKAAFDDPSPFVRSIAASALGDLGLEHEELRGRSAELLLRGLTRYGEEERGVWGSFYRGALTLAEVEWSKRPLRPGELTPDQLDQAVLKRLRSLVC